MTKKFIKVEGGIETAMLVAALAQLFGMKVTFTDAPAAPGAGKPEFDLNTYTKPEIPKTLIATVGSISNPGQVHVIRKDKEDNLYCDCKGFTYRGTCRHVDKVAADRKRREMPKTFAVNGITVRRFHSRTQPGVIYDVKLHNGDFVCTCPGFNFQGRCKHVLDTRKGIQYPGSI